MSPTLNLLLPAVPANVGTARRAISNLCDHTELTFERWRETIDVNLNGTFLIVFAVKDEMIARRFGR